MTSIGPSLVSAFSQIALPRPGGGGSFEAPPAGAVADAENADPFSRGPATVVELSAGAEEGGGLPGQSLTDEEKAQVRELKKLDAEVRRHEQAHARAGAPHTGAPSYEYETGPDGKQYAVGGTTPIDVSPVAGDPAATIDKMRTVKAAATAPAEPSGQDRAVAAKADAEMRKAQAELAVQKTEEAAATAGAALAPAGAPIPAPASVGQAVLAYRDALTLTAT